ncbi:hypothetical protein [Vibrio astriarenae]|uniref:hypothetical protein n=1 Tax=Vibrio astriarenae TaxID=1481923 RepID=UPI00373635E5
MKKLTIGLLSLLLFQPISVYACLLHAAFSKDIDQPPGALWVQIQTQVLMQEGKLSPTRLLESDAGFRQVHWWLTLLSKELYDTGQEDTYLYLVDIGLWVKYQRSGGGKLEYEVFPDTNNESVIILARQTLHAIVSEQMTLAKALDMEVVANTER